jgi:hypothetical protein
MIETRIVFVVGRTVKAVDDEVEVPLGEPGFVEVELVQLAKISASIASQN